jgi:O-antigen ligase
LNIWGSTGGWPDSPLATRLTFVSAVVLAILFGWTAATENWKPFAVLVGVSMTPVLIRWPVVSSFGLYVFVLPFEALTIPGGATVPRLAGILAAGVLLCAGLVERRLMRPPSVGFWWAGFVLWATLTVAWAVDPQVAIGRVPTAISLLGLFLIAISFRVSRSELNAICILTVVGGVAAVIAAYVSGLGEAFESGRRGMLGIGEAKADANAFAASLLPPLALAIAGSLKLRGFVVRTAALAAVPVLGAGLFISMSRGALLALAVIVACLVYRIGIRWHALLVVLIFSSLVMAMPERFITRATGPVTGEDSTGSGRTQIWSVGLVALEEFWILGAGLSNFPSVYARHVAVQPGEATGSHNTYLGTWVELGIVGLVILLLAMTSLLRIAWGGRHSGSLVLYATEAYLIGWLVSALFFDALWAKRLWTLAIMMVWAGRLAAESAVERVSIDRPPKPREAIGGHRALTP